MKTRRLQLRFLVPLVLSLVAMRADESWVLIRSRFAGAARELSEALIANSYHVGEAADVLYRAIALPVAEQRERMANLRLTVREFSVFKGVLDDKQERTRLTAGSLVPSRYGRGGGVQNTYSLGEAGPNGSCALRRLPDLPSTRSRHYADRGCTHAGVASPATG
ncbi:MAG: hypothetical protein ABI648_11645 [Betaproteobacteria bacterium]|jgi:hypothetical protein